MSTLIKYAKLYAEKHHGNQKYGKYPYTKHLDDVYNLLASLNVNENILIAGYLHDIIEDTKITYEDLVDEFGDDIALIVNACTKYKKETVEDYFIGIYMFDHIAANIIKLADRICNLNQGVSELNIDKLTKYYNLHSLFLKYVCELNGLKYNCSTKENKKIFNRLVEKYIVTISNVYSVINTIKINDQCLSNAVEYAIKNNRTLVYNGYDIRLTDKIQYAFKDYINKNKNLNFTLRMISYHQYCLETLNNVTTKKYIFVGLPYNVEKYYEVNL